MDIYIYVYTYIYVGFYRKWEWMMNPNDPQWLSKKWLIHAQNISFKGGNPDEPSNFWVYTAFRQTDKGALW